MEIALFIGLIGFASVFVMMSLGYENKKDDVRTLEYHGTPIISNMSYEIANKLLNDIKKDIRTLELEEKGKNLQIAHGEYDGEYEISKKGVGRILKKESKTIPKNLEKLYESKDALEEIIAVYDKQISNKAGDAQSIFNPNPVPA